MNRLLTVAWRYWLVIYNVFAYLMKPVVETVFSNSMQLAISSAGKAAGLLVQEYLLPLLDAVLQFDFLDWTQ